MRSARLPLITLAALGVLAGCGGSSHKAAPAAKPHTRRDQWGTVWLCRPGQAPDPCASDLTATVVTPGGKTRVEKPVAAPRPAVDCFYVYPTISSQPTINANLSIDLREDEVAIAQASRFSPDCRLYAPVYRQITLTALDHPGRITLGNALIAYRSVLSAFRDYLAHYNHGRGVVFIGHSQGAAILIRLLQQEVDNRPAVRRRLVSAILLGGNVTTRKGSAEGGSFSHIPACRSGGQTGCVVAYSSFTSKPSKNSQFGRTTSDAGVRLLAPHRSPDTAILCVNPATPGGGRTALEPYLPSLILGFIGGGGLPRIQTPWVALPGEYTARCETQGDATWLQITPTGARGGLRLLTKLDRPAFGLHVLDVNIALGNLVELVRRQAAAYVRR